MGGRREKRDSKRDHKKDDKKANKFLKKRRKKVCIFCAGQAEVDYKNPNSLHKFITDRGKIAPRRMTGCCAKHQRLAAKLVKRARHAAVIPYVIE